MHKSDISNSSTVVRQTRDKDEVRATLKILLSILPAPSETRRGKRFEESALATVYKQFNTKRKTTKVLKRKS